MKKASHRILQKAKLVCYPKNPKQLIPPKKKTLVVLWMKSEEIALVRFLAQFGELKERRNGLPVVVNTTTGRKQQEPKEQPIKDPVSMNFCMFSFFF